MSSDPHKTAKASTPATSATQQEVFVPPAEWRVRCEVRKLTPHTKLEYLSLNNDLLRCLVGVEPPSFIVFFLVGWDLYEYLRPADYTLELMQEMLDIHKKWPTQTRILVLQNDYARYEKLASAFRNLRFETAAGGASMALLPVYNCYQELSNASQSLARGGLNMEAYARVAAGASFAVMHMQSTKSILGFLVAIVGKDALLYDHSAVTALVAAAISWNVLEMTKRESKLCSQAALMHDVERNCAHLFKPAVHDRISTAAIKELKNLQDSAGVGFHAVILQTMGQYREKFTGGGFPGTNHGASEERGDIGIERTARIVAIACAFSEYLLKRQDKHSLSLTMILDLIKQRTKNDFDPDIVTALIEAATSDAIRKFGKSKEKIEDEAEYDD